MRDELLFRIREARCRMEGRPPSDEDQAMAIRRKAIEDFQVLLAQKLDIGTRWELLFQASYIWFDTGPAVCFDVDDRHFVLAQEFDELALFEAGGGSPGTRMELCRLSLNEEQLEDRLLAALGVALGIR